MKRGGGDILSEKMLQRNPKRREEGSGDDTTLIRVYAQVEVHTTQFSPHMQSGSPHGLLEESIELSFLFQSWEKASALRQGHWPPFRCIALCGTSTVSQHSKPRELVLPPQTAMHRICGTTTTSCTTLSSTTGTLNNSVSQTSVLSRP